MTLSKILDARDPYVGGHAEQVSRTRGIAADWACRAERIAARAPGRLPARHRQDRHLRASAAQAGQLTEEEYEYVKTHAAMGGEFLETSQALRHLAPFVRGHHERWDGTGYPTAARRGNPAGSAYPARVCDAVEAMASDRPYRQGKSVSEIIAEVKRCAGTHSTRRWPRSLCASPSAKASGS